MKILKTNTKNVNTPSLFKEVDDFMLEVFTQMHIEWKDREHRDEFVWLMDDFLEQFQAQTGKITQFEVMCDSRNNLRSDMESGIFHFTIQYVQKNCFNTTEIDYVIED